METVRKIFNFRRRGRERSGSSGGRDVAPGRPAGYDLKDSDLGKLHKAASVGDLAKVKQLIKQRSDINQTDQQLRTALHVACAVGCFDIVQFLANSGAELNLLDGEGRTPLMKAVQGQHEACVRILLEKHAEPHLADGEGNTALHFSANLPSVTVAQLILNCPVDINASNQDGLTPLNLAFRKGHVEIVQLLLNEGADFDVNDPGNLTQVTNAKAQSPTSMTQLSAEASLSVVDHKPPAEEADFTEDFKPLMISMKLTSSSTKRWKNIAFKPRLSPISEDSETESAPSTPHFSRLPNRRPDALPSANTSKDKKTGSMSKYIVEDYSFSESDDDSLEDNSLHTQRFLETPGAERGADEPSTSTSALRSGLREKEIKDETEEIPDSDEDSDLHSDVHDGAEDGLVFSEPDAASSSDNEEFEFEEEPEGISDDEDKETNDETFNSSPLSSQKPQSHDSDDYSDLESENDEAEEEPVSPEPNAATTSDSEAFEEPEGISDDKEILEEETAPSKFNSSPKPQSHDSDDYSDLESENDAYERAEDYSDLDSENDEAEDEPISPEPNADRASESEPEANPEEADDNMEDIYEGAEFEEEPEGISNDKEILEEERAPSRFNSCPKPQSHDSDDFSGLESENDANERAEDYSDLDSENDEAEDEPVSPEPNADRASESEPEANPEEADDNVEDIYEGAEFEEEPEGISNDKEILEEERAPSRFNSSPKPQSHDSDDFSDLESENDACERAEDYSDLDSENDEAEEEPVSPEPNAATTSDSEAFEEPEGISDDKEILEEETAPSRFNSSPKPQSHDSDDFSDLESENDAYERAEDEPVYPEPNADRASESEPEANPEEADDNVEDIYEGAEFEEEPEGISNDKEILEEESAPSSLNSSPPQSHDSDDFSDLESDNDAYEQAEDEPVSPEPNAATTSDTEEFELKEEPEGISDDEEILEEKETIDNTPPVSVNSSPLPSPESQIHADPDCESDQDNDVYDGAGYEHMIPEPDAATTSDSEEFELQEEPEGSSSKTDSDLDSSLSDNDMEDKDEILEEESAPSSLNSSPLLSPKPQSHEHPEYDSGWESDSEVYEQTQEEPESGQEDEQETFCGDDGEMKENQSLEELNFMEDLTQSSDTASDDLESFMQELDSNSLDSASTMKVQNVFRGYERAVQKLKNKNSYLSNKVKQLETEKADLKNSLDEVSGIKPELQSAQLELQMEVDHLKLQLKQEQENRRQVTASHNAMKDKLQKTEDQNQLQVREKQQMEFTLRNCELEMRTLVVSMKQLEEEHGAAQKLLAHERSARALQDELLHKQQEVKEENADLLQKTSTLQEQIRSLTAELERLQANSSLKEKLLFEESESLKEQLQNAEREAKANSDALSQTAIDCTHQLAALKSHLGLMRNNFEHEKKARETLEKEVDFSRARLAAGAQEVERWVEKSQRLEDRLTADAARHYEEVSGLCVKLSHSQSDAAELRRQLQDANDNRDAKETALVNAQKELRDQVCTLEEQKACALEDLDQLKQKLSQREDECVQAEKRFAEKEVDLQMRHERLKRKALNIREQKNEAETRLKQGETRLKQVETRLKQVETSLSQKISSNSDLQRKLDCLQTMVKTTEKRLRDQDKTGDFIMNMDLQELLDRETIQRRQLVKDNDELREELSSLKCSEQRRLNELQELRRQTDFAQRERSLTEERSRDELKHKLEQVNLFLQTQAASQKAQDQINANNAASMQSRLEQRIRELENEVSRVRSTTTDGLAVRSELDRYRSMYSEESLLRKSLAARLERSNARLTDAQTQLLTERTKYLIATSGLDSSVGESHANTAI